MDWPLAKTSRRFALNWTYLSAIAQGVSPIDLQGLALRNLADARQYAREYGYDVDQPGVTDYLRAIQQEALGFVRSQFLSAAQQSLIPPEVAQPEDPLQLLLLASHSSHRPDPQRLWACTLLKVMHGLFYIDNNLKLRHFETIRQQVFAGLDEVLVEREGRSYLRDGLLELPLVHVERKRNKGRHSILLKLLQKPEYVAADIHDHLGLRLTLQTRVECLLALELLRRAHLVSASNLEVSRTRNTLVDLDAAKQVFTRWRALLERSPGYPQALLQRMDEELAALAPQPQRRDNPHSAAEFHSLQLTVRKMIQLPPDAGSEAGCRFFFAYEIQLLDAASLAQSQQGAASHEAYKQRQVETARRRVFGPQLLAWLGAQDKHPPPS
ncbi:TIGR04552 family protein [Inhella proteolytica]|uniref:TIGR04552 family protein n=1 Tax=Inhella proteolytica TaxID=2795029 RepID=A0A931J3E0_9BURK|nr:TIGR04552 family protein [Inhella proteolytica]MBH9577018.1 TIGR04552 family protein [Inhella proteolytica]